MTVYTNGPTSDILTGTDDSDQFYSDYNEIYPKIGSTDNDTLYGGGGFDAFYATLGTDFIDGGAYTDRIDFSNAISFDDPVSGIVVSITPHDVTVDIKAGTYKIQWGYKRGEDIVTSITTEGTFTNVELFTGGTGKDIFTGSSSQDRFSVSVGGGIYDGRSGTDTLGPGTIRYGDKERSGVIVNAQTGKFTFYDNSVSHFSNFEIYELSFYNDKFVGSDEDETVAPIGGADKLNGGGGFDYLDYRVTNVVMVNLTKGEADVTAIDLETSGLATSKQSIVNFEGVIGSTGNDKLIGSNVGNDLLGAEGDDTLIGKAGADILLGQDGDDVLKGDGGNDILIGGSADFETADGFVELFDDSGADTLFGGKGNDQLLSGDGNDKLFGGRGNDELLGGAGHDTILGGAGRDTIEGNGGRDEIDGGGGKDEMDGDAGDDVMDGGSGNDIMDGGRGKDKMVGAGGNDSMQGGSGNDRLKGGNANDWLNGGEGNDKLFGGRGADTFVLSKGHDVIGDFEFATDKIDVSATKGLKYEDFAAVMADVADITAADTLIVLNDRTTLTLIGVSFEDLTAENFIYPDDGLG